MTITITRNNRRAVLTLRCENCGAHAERPSELFAQAWVDRHECSVCDDEEEDDN